MKSTGLIVLSPGWGSVVDYLNDSSLIKLRNNGYDVAILSYPRYGLDSIRINALKAHTALENYLENQSYSHVSFVGHSMSGLIGRYILQYLQATYIHSLITIGAPHNGANLSKLVSRWSNSAKEMECGSDFIKDLNKLSPPRCPTLNIIGGLDFITRTELPWAENITLAKKTHLSLILSETTLETIRGWLPFVSHKEGKVMYFNL